MLVDDFSKNKKDVIRDLQNEIEDLTFANDDKVDEFWKIKLETIEEELKQYEEKYNKKLSKKEQKELHGLIRIALSLTPSQLKRAYKEINAESAS